jgi:hypothetical protein
VPRPTLYDHPKFQRLVHLLALPEPHVLGHLEFLWRVGYSSGNPVVGDEIDVELAAKWTGERGAFVKAMVSVRMLDTDETDGSVTYSIHDLHENAPDYVSTRWAREQEKKKVKHCAQCNAEFKSSETHARFCTDACRITHWRCEKMKRTVKRTKRSVTISNEPPTPTPAPAHAPTPTPAPAHAPLVSLPAVPAAEKPETKARPRDELFDAICEVGAADPKLDGSRIGRACKVLRSADQPYTAADVRALPSALHAHGLDFTLTIEAIAKHIGRVRVPPPKSARSNGQPTLEFEGVKRFAERSDRGEPG